MHMCFCVLLYFTACMLYYCNTVGWAWWDWGLIWWLTILLQCFDTVGWVTWPVKISSPNDLYCVEWDVKPYSTNPVAGLRRSTSKRRWDEGRVGEKGREERGREQKGDEEKICLFLIFFMATPLLICLFLHQQFRSFVVKVGSELCVLSVAVMYRVCTLWNSLCQCCAARGFMTSLLPSNHWARMHLSFSCASIYMTFLVC